MVTGCEKKNANGVAAQGIEETNAIAEEGFIYGLPIVINYAVLYEYALDCNSGQFKAPFNKINVVANERKSRWLADALHPERLARQSKGIQLVARTQ